jgi:3-hydroxyacyl-[acyl-carrier-protein] dehydratase
MSKDLVLQSIPHRPPFLFVDEVLELTDEKIVTKRVIRAEEPQFEGHYPGNPIMPGVLLCESVFQTAAIYLVKKLEGEGTDASQKTPILARITDAKFKNMVVPGDEVTIEATYKETMGKFHFMTGKVIKDGRPALTIGYALALIDQES